VKNPTKEQVKEWNRTYYLKNKHKRKTQYTAHRKRVREWYRELKKNLKCERCGFSHPAALAFHHKDGKTKVSDISAMVSQTASRKKIEEEIAKCEVLCHNCHAIHHAEQ
jgi:hypothetical protein